jgi:hypothetical protein
MRTDQTNLDYRIHQEIMDSLDEELEMELDDERLGTKISENRKSKAEIKVPRLHHRLLI